MIGGYDAKVEITTAKLCHNVLLQVYIVCKSGPKHLTPSVKKPVVDLEKFSDSWLDLIF